MPKRLKFSEFKKIYGKVPRLCVDLIVKDKRGILLIKRSIDPSMSKWHFPGGTVLFGEKIANALNRVAKEEIGSNVKFKKILGVVEFTGNSPHAHAVSIACLVEPVTSNLRGGWQGEELAFFKKIPPNTIKEQKLFLKKQKLLK